MYLRKASCSRTSYDIERHLTTSACSCYIGGRAIVISGIRKRECVNGETWYDGISPTVMGRTRHHQHIGGAIYVLPPRDLGQGRSGGHVTLQSHILSEIGIVCKCRQDDGRSI